MTRPVLCSGTALRRGAARRVGALLAHGLLAMAPAMLVMAPAMVAPALGAALRGDPPPPSLSFTDTTTFVPPDGTFSFAVNTSQLALTDELAWTVHSLIPNDPNDVGQALGGEPGPPLRPEERRSIGELKLGDQPTRPNESTDTVTVTVPVRAVSDDSDRVFLPDAGIYPVSVRLMRGGSPIDERVLPLVRLAQNPGSPGRLVHLVATLRPAPALSSDGGASPDPADRSSLESLIDQLEALPGESSSDPPMSVSFPAELVETLANSADAGDVELVERLAAVAGRATWLATPYVPMDLGAWSGADVARNPLIDRSYDASASRHSELLGVSTHPGLIPPDPTLAAPTMGLLTDRGASAVLLDPTTPGVNDPAPSTGSNRAVTVVGTAAPEALRPARDTEVAGDASVPTRRATLPGVVVERLDGTGGFPPDAADVAADLAALSAPVLAQTEDGEQPPAGSPPDAVALQVPDGLGPAQLRSLLASLDEAAGILAPTTADGLTLAIGHAPQRRDVVLQPATSERLGDMELATYRAQQRINAAAGLDANSPQVALAERLMLVSPHVDLRRPAALAYLLAAQGGAEAVLDSVTLGELRALTLAARRTQVPLRFRNALDNPVQVDLRVRSERLRLVDANDEGLLRLELPPGNSTVEVSVEVVTSGVFEVTFDVLIPGEVDLLERQEVQVRSRAFSGVGVGLSVASLLVLLAWWIRTTRASKSNTTPMAENDRRRPVA